MNQEETIIASVKDKIKQLGDRNEALQKELDNAKASHSSLKEELADRDRKLAELAEKNKVLKMAKSLSGAEGDSSDTKHKINELVREIDKCIALLNK